ncbi:MAG: hypothetical protein SFV23_20145, partial [Planctomycetaceae bacterium]|nr:hypothetical protein [Planctomycetaceae bacterium]
AVVGKFTLASGLHPDGEFTEPRLYLPVDSVPAEYDLQLVVERKAAGGKAFMIGIVWQGGQGSIIADGFSNPPAWGLELIDGVNVKANGTYQPGERITFGKLHDVVVQVRHDGVTALCDGATVFSWKGKSERLTTHAMWDVPKKDRLFLGFQGPYVVHQARFTPVTLPSAGASIQRVELLPLVDLKRDAGIGDWSRNAEGIACANPAGGSVLQFPYEPPEEYDFEIEFTTTGVGNNVNQYLVSNGRMFTWKLNSHRVTPPLYGFELLDGKMAKDFKEAAMQMTDALVDGRRYRSTVEVRRGSLRALLDGKELVKWSGDFQRLSMEASTPMPFPGRLGIGSWRRPATFHSATVREISGAGKLHATRVMHPSDQQSTVSDASSNSFPAGMERRAAEWVISRGGTLELTYDSRTLASVDELPAGPLQIKYIAFKKPLSGTDADLADLGALPEMVSISLDMTRVTPAGLARLERCPKLERLSLGGFPITDEALKAASRFPKLVGLFLAKSDVSHRHCVAISESFPNLKNLNLMNNGQLDDAAIAPLSRLKRLTSLQLQQTKVTAAGVATLKRAMPNCNIEWDGSN